MLEFSSSDASVNAARRTTRYRFSCRYPSRHVFIVFAVLAAAAESSLGAQNDSFSAGNEASSIDARHKAWDGLYFGASLGGVWARSSMRTTVAPSSAADSYFFASSVPVIDDAGRQRTQPGGPMGVLQTGYMFQQGPWVAGLEADFGYLGLSGHSTGSAIYPCCAPTGFSMSEGIRSNWLATVRPRIGITHGHMLFFLSGGAAVSEIRTGFAFSDNNSEAAASGSASRTAIGYAVGGGIEAKLAGRWSIKADYLLVNLGTLSGTSANLVSSYGPSPENRFQYSADLRANLARLGVNYRFH
jgi:outer membrane immunogenic protein